MYIISGELSEKSRESVGKLLTRPNKHRSRGTKNNDNNMQQYDLSSEVCPDYLFVFLTLLKS